LAAIVTGSVGLLAAPAMALSSKIPSNQGSAHIPSNQGTSNTASRTVDGSTTQVSVVSQRWLFPTASLP
jgi:hypothetical protein